MDGLSVKVGERIRELRKYKDLGQEELVYRASMHYTFIGKVERGEKNISIESLEKVTKALGISLEEFFSQIDPKNKETLPLKK